MKLSDFDYHLPPEAIAQEPLADRAGSKLLWLHRDTGEIEHRHFRDVVQILRSGDLLVLNDTRVTARRLLGEKTTGGAAEFLLLKDLGDNRYEALAKPGRRLQPGTKVNFEGNLSALVQLNLVGGKKLIRLEGDLDQLTSISSVPLPPYITAHLDDEERYQTVYSSQPGSAAAPTAGLHFTPEIFEELDAKGIDKAFVTLDVGIDTFRPVQVENLDEHEMHGEECSVSHETAQKIKECQGRVIAVGTTTVRTLESFAVGKRALEPGSQSTSIFIKPGFTFNTVDGMFTNFHMPKTTMLVMLSAIVPRDQLMRAYQEALRKQYRFLSFGDSMLIL